MSLKKVCFSTISYIYDMDETQFPVPTKIFDGSSTDKNYPILNIKNTYKKESIFLASVIGIGTTIFYIAHKLS